MEGPKSPHPVARRVKRICPRNANETASNRVEGKDPCPVISQFAIRTRIGPMLNTSVRYCTAGPVGGCGRHLPKALRPKRDPAPFVRRLLDRIQQALIGDSVGEARRRGRAGLDGVCQPDEQLG